MCSVSLIYRELLLGTGDTIFFHYSGHGSQVAAKDGTATEGDGQDECLVPLDAYRNQGREYWDLVIKDDWLTEQFHDKLPDGVKCICNFDCCHSGTMADLAEIRDIESGEKVCLKISMRGVKLAAKDSFLMGGKSDPYLKIESTMEVCDAKLPSCSPPCRLSLSLCVHACKASPAI